MQIGSVFSGFPGMIQEECEEKDDEKTTEESQFFHDSGKDEIRFRYRQEAEENSGSRGGSLCLKNPPDPMAVLAFQT